MSPPLLVADELYRFFHIGDDETRALRGVSMTIHRGELVAVTGPSGSGKSTLLACLAGIDDPDGGTVTIDGHRLSRRSEARRAGIRARSIGVLFQSGNLIEHLDVASNVELAQSFAGRRDGKAGRALLEDLGLGHRARARPSELSGGELARAGLAAALANDPPLLLADEPTGELDQANTHRVATLLRDRADRGRAVLVVTHNAAVADVATRRLALRDGRLDA